MARSLRLAVLLVGLALSTPHSPLALLLPQTNSTVPYASLENTTRLQNWPPLPYTLPFESNPNFKVSAAEPSDPGLRASVLDSIGDIHDLLKSEGTPSDPMRFHHEPFGPLSLNLDHARSCRPMNRSEFCELLSRVWMLVHAFGPTRLGVSVGEDSLVRQQGTISWIGRVAFLMYVREPDGANRGLQLL